MSKLRLGVFGVVGVFTFIFMIVLHKYSNVNDTIRTYLSILWVLLAAVLGLLFDKFDMK